jgi:hypothetical protein
MASEQKTHCFKATVYKTGINFCVDVPAEMTSALEAVNGYIRIVGTVNGIAFTKSLVPVKNGLYRLYINTITLKDIRSRVGETMDFVIGQDTSNPELEHPMSADLCERLQKKGLLKYFDELTRYLNNLKTPEVLEKQTARLIAQLEANMGVEIRIP